MFNLLSKLKMKSPSKERLEGIIALGKWRYVLTRGVLMFGLVLPISAVSADYLQGESLQLQTIMVALVVGPITGLCFGLYTWADFNRRYEKFMKVEG